jgi:hypothetical protein
MDLPMPVPTWKLVTGGGFQRLRAGRAFRALFLEFTVSRIHIVILTPILSLFSRNDAKMYVLA